MFILSPSNAIFILFDDYMATVTFSLTTSLYVQHVSDIEGSLHLTTTDTTMETHLPQIHVSTTPTTKLNHIPAETCEMHTSFNMKVGENVKSFHDFPCQLF
jgi:hypothetical protein